MFLVNLFITVSVVETLFKKNADYEIVNTV